MTFDKQIFWQKKIIAWENARYHGEVKEQGLIEKIVRGGGSSIRERLAMFVEILKPHVRDKKILDLGCGSGFLFKELAQSGAREFIGIDLAESAVERAKQLAAEHGYQDRSQFIHGDVARMEYPPFDIAVSLGLLDWLTDEELHMVFKKIRNKQFVMAIAKKQNSVEQWLHRGYVTVAYGYRSQGYVPRYYAVSDMLALLKGHGFHDVKVICDRRISFGAILHNLPSTS